MTSGIDKAVDGFKRLGLSQKEALSVLSKSKYADEVVDLTASVSTLTTKGTAGVTGLGAAFKGFGMSLLSIAPTLAAIGIAAAGVYAAYKYAHQFEDQLEKSSEAAQTYQESKAEVESLNSELETTQARIAELQAQDTLTLTEEAELANLQAQTAELERQIDLKNRIAETNRQEDEKEAMKTLELERTKDLTTEETHFSEATGTERTRVSETDLITATKNEINQLKKLKKERDNLTKRSRIGLNDDEITKIDNQIEALDADIERYTTEITGNLDTMNQLKLSIPVDSEMYKNISDVSDMFTNMDLSEAEQAVAKIESFFSGSDITSTAISDRLKEMAADGTLTAEAVERMGFAIDGVDAADIARYFNDMAKSAQEAADAANQIDGSFEGVATAMESENAGSNYEKLNGYLKTAKDLYDKDLTGTDDFKSVAELLSYGDSKGNADQFISDYNRVMKYITEDDDGNLTKSGIGQFLNDLSDAGKNVGKDWATLNDETGEWAFNLDNTAEAAKEMGLSIESMEAILGRLQDYDNVGDFQFKSALEDISDATTALEGMKTLYDEMDEGRSKEALGLKIEGWDEQYAQWENDWSTLDENAVIHIKLDYDLSKIQSEIDEIQNLIEFDGDDTVKNRAALGAKNDQYIKTAESSFGISQLEPVQIPVEYSNIDNAIEKLKTELQNKDLTTDQKIDVQAEINNLQAVQMDLLDAFSASEYSVNLSADSSVEEIQSKFNDFIQSADGQSILTDIDVSDDNLKKVIADITGQSVDDIQLSITAEDEATPVVENLVSMEVADKIVTMVAEDEASGALYLWNSLSMDPKFSSMSADDQATFVIREWNGLQPEQKQALLQADMTANDNASAPIDNVTGKANTLAGINPNVGIGATDSASSVISSVMAKVNSADGMTATTTIITRHVTVGSPSGGGVVQRFNGTAHAHGTVYGHAFASGNTGKQWGLPNDERALINEVGEEILVRDGKAISLNNGYPTFANLKKGDIIFNHKQSEELLKNGYITGSHAKVYGGMGAFANGTLTSNAYAGGASGSFSFTSGSSKKSYSSSTSSKSATSSANTASKAATSAAKATTKTAKSAESTADAMKDLLDKLNKYVNWVKIKLDRVNRDTQKAIDAIDTAVGLANKQSRTATAISKTQTEMSVASQAYDKYMSEAASVASQTGLSSDIQAKVRNGSIEISEYDDNTQEKIKLYQQYIELALEAQDTIDDLKKQEQELALQRLENIQDYYDAVNAVYDATKSANEAKMELYTALGNDVDSKGIKDALNNSISQQQSTYNKALQQLTDYQSEFNDLVAKGYIQRDSDAWYEGQKIIQEFTAQVDESATALIELQDQLREIDYTKLQQTIDRISSSLERLQNGESLSEKRDERVTEEEYRKQISEENANINSNYSLRNKKLREQGLYAVGSSRYNEIAKEIAKIDDEIYSSLENIEDLKDKIFEVRFADFNYDRQSMQYLMDDLGVLQDLLDSDTFVDSKTGVLTGEGLANIAIVGQQMAIAKQEIAEYTAGIKKLDGMLQSGLISTTEYEEKQREFLEAIQESAISVSDYRQELIKLYVEQLEAENNVLQESITLHKKAHEAAKKYNDYANKVSADRKDVSAIQAQIAALQGVKLFAHVYLTAGNPLEPYKLQRKYEIKLSVNV